MAGLMEADTLTLKQNGWEAVLVVLGISLLARCGLPPLSSRGYLGAVAVESYLRTTVAGDHGRRP